MSFELYGGIPRPRRFSAANGNPVTTTGFEIMGPLGKTNFLQITNFGAVNCRIYFEKKYFDLDALLTGTDGFIELVSGGGFYEGPANLEDESVPYSQPLFYVRAMAATTELEVITYHRRS